MSSLGGGQNCASPPPPHGAGSSSNGGSPIVNSGGPLQDEDMVAVDLSKPAATSSMSSSLTSPPPLMSAMNVSGNNINNNNNNTTTNNNNLYKLPAAGSPQSIIQPAFSLAAQNLLPSSQPEVSTPLIVFTSRHRWVRNFERSLSVPIDLCVTSRREQRSESNRIVAIE